VLPEVKREPCADAPGCSGYGRAGPDCCAECSSPLTMLCQSSAPASQPALPLLLLLRLLLTLQGARWFWMHRWFCVWIIAFIVGLDLCRPTSRRI
jgi:hypothetical protein